MPPSLSHHPIIPSVHSSAGERGREGTSWVREELSRGRETGGAASGKGGTRKDHTSPPPKRVGSGPDPGLFPKLVWGPVGGRSPLRMVEFSLHYYFQRSFSAVCLAVSNLF